MLKALLHIKPQWFYLLSALLLGTCYTVLVPPFQSPDEFNHFCRAYQISEGTFMPINHNQRLGGPMPRSFNTFFEPFELAAKNPDYRFTADNLDESCNVALNPHQKTFRDFANTAYYSPVSYLPQALVMAVCRLCNSSLGTMYYAGRICIFLLWMFSVFYCICLLPVYKWLFTLLALLPTNLFIACTYSADNVSNLLSFLVIGLVFKWAFDRTLLTRQQVVTLALLAILLALAKLVYIGLLLVLFIIPAHRFKTPAFRWLSLAIIFLPAAVIALWWSQRVGNFYISYASYNPEFVAKASLANGSDYHQQLHMFISRPWYFFKVYYHSIFNPEQYYLRTYIGAFGAFLGYNLPAWLIPLAYGLIALVSLGEKHPQAFSVKQNIWLLATALLCLGLLFFTLHLIWDPVGSGYVWLVQGRYLIPIVPLLFVAFGALLPDLQFSTKGLVIASVVLFNGFALYQAYQLYFYEPHPFITRINCGFEEVDGSGNFKSDNEHFLFANQTNQTRLAARRGKHSAMLGPKNQYGLFCALKNLQVNDMVEVEIWRKGKNGTVLVNGNAKDCGEFNAPANAYALQGQEGWNKIHYLVRVPCHCDSLQAAFSAYLLENDTACFDDLRLTLKTFKRPW